MQAKSTPLHYVSSDGFDIYVGKNNYQNDHLTFKVANGADWWFHAKGYAGSHVLVTKPSELAFYPIPKLFIQHVGGHELWGAIHAAELGDGTYEVAPGRETTDMLRLLQSEPEILLKMNRCILENKAAGLYNGAYEVVKLAVKKH